MMGTRGQKYRVVWYGKPGLVRDKMAVQLLGIGQVKRVRV